MDMNFGSKAPSQYALDAIKALRTAPLAKAVSIRKQAARQRSVPLPFRLDAGLTDQWPVRDQFGRGTCVAFATLAAVELHRALRDDMLPERLSEQFLHERMVSSHPASDTEEAGMPKGGVLLHQALRALEQDGVVGAEYAPYKSLASSLNGQSQPVPSPAAVDAALSNLIQCRAYGTIGTPEGMDPDRVDNFQPGEDTAEKMLDFLREGLPVVVGLPLFQHASGLNNWILPSTIRSGMVPCPDDLGAHVLEGPRADGHVVCLTGYRPDPAEPSGGWFVFRNSWGLSFGTHSALKLAGTRGYGLLSATHINNYCWEYLVPVPQEVNA
jgi:hypothetical protein